MLLNQPRRCFTICSFRTATDVKECELNTHGCAELCIEEEGGFKCACKDGFELADDGKTCVGMSTYPLYYTLYI